MNTVKNYFTFLLLLCFLVACTTEKTKTEVPPETSATDKVIETITKNINKNLYWGDTHLHTTNSPDAFANGNRMSPDEAYQFAKGLEITTAAGLRVKLNRPLDFLVIADHAEGFGLGQEILAGNETLLQDPTIRRWKTLFEGSIEDGIEAAGEMPRAIASGTLSDVVTDPKFVGPMFMRVWREYIQQAEQHNQPGIFTSLIGYEWSSMPGGNNLHRVVIYRDGGDKASQTLPFSALQSPDPKDLWAAMQAYEDKTGGKVLAIPHNGNLSNGRMFSLTDFSEKPMTQAYAQTRARREPLVEATQYKGDSESHPFLSPNDEFAAYGDAGWDMGNMTLSEIKTNEMLAGEYAREALKSGLQLQEQLGENPYKFGMIGSTDSHTSLASAEENNWTGKFTHQLNNPNRAKRKGAQAHGELTHYGWQYLSSGYAAVWAESNTREDLWDAMQRKEVYGTTGPRIQLRFFGGWNFQSSDIDKADYVTYAYQNGVPMGSDLTHAPANKAPSFLLVAAKDPEGANLDRIQIIKGWIADGQTYEQVINVAWSGDRALDAEGKLSPVGNTVDPATAMWVDDIGAPELATVWTDPDFDHTQNAFYYVRVLEIPTPRWTTYDALKYDVELPVDVPPSIQERAYSSPIWYMK